MKMIIGWYGVSSKNLTASSFRVLDDLFSQKEILIVLISNRLTFSLLASNNSEKQVCFTGTWAVLIQHTWNTFLVSLSFSGRKRNLLPWRALTWTWMAGKAWQTSEADRQHLQRDARQSENDLMTLRSTQPTASLNFARSKGITTFSSRWHHVLC